MRGCGRIERPAFPAPSDVSDGKTKSRTRVRAARSRRCVSFTREAHSAHGSSSLPRLRGVFVGRVAHRERSDTMCRVGGLSDRAHPHDPHPGLRFAVADPPKGGGKRRSELRLSGPAKERTEGWCNGALSYPAFAFAGYDTECGEAAWIASLEPSSGAHWRNPLARNDRA